MRGKSAHLKRGGLTGGSISIFPRPQLLPDAFAVFRKVCAKLFDSHPVHACRAFVPYDLSHIRLGNTDKSAKRDEVQKLPEVRVDVADR